MASKASKRAATTSVTAAAKKAKVEEVKVEPVFAGIIATLQNVDHLPERCREMLMTMAGPCLSAPKNERHAVQKLAVSMIEETLREVKDKMTQAIDQEQKQLAELEGAQVTLAARLNEAEADFALKTSTEQEKQSAFDDASKAVQEGEISLAEAKEAERQSEEPLAKLLKEKAMFEELFQEHYKVPMEANQGPHYSFFEPHIATLDLDESLAIALPSSCSKNKEHRGGFDGVVLSELEKALCAKIELLGKAAEDEKPKIAECKASVVASETALAQKNGAEKAASSELDAARAAREAATTDLSKAKEEHSSIAPGIKQVTGKRDGLMLELNTFEKGPLATFETLRDKSSMQEEAANAGA